MMFPIIFDAVTANAKQTESEYRAKLTLGLDKFISHIDKYGKVGSVFIYLDNEKRIEFFMQTPLHCLKSKPMTCYIGIKEQGNAVVLRTNEIELSMHNYAAQLKREVSKFYADTADMVIKE